MAAFRFGLVAPVLNGTYTDSSKKAYYRRITENPIALPDGRVVSYAYKTVEKWAERYAKGGLDALEPRARSDKGMSRTLSQEAIDEIFRVKSEFPRLNALQLHAHLMGKGFVTYPTSVRSVQRFIKDHNLKAGLPDQVAKDRKAFEMPFFCDMWEADTCHFPHFRENGGPARKLYLMAIVDDHSRLCVAARFFYEDSAANFQKLLKDAVAAYGIPTKLYLDNGAPFRNTQLTQICAAIGTVLIHTPVRDGAAKAKVERFFGTVKSRWLYATDLKAFNSLDSLNAAMADYIRTHNTTINASIDSSPMERFLASRTHAKLPKSVPWLDECFLNRVSRKVRNDATVSIDNCLLDVPKQFIGRTVEIRFLPGCLAEAFVFESGRKFPLRFTDKVKNAKKKRDNPYPIDYSRMGGGV
jgi:transposase InsO family protein